MLKFKNTLYSHKRRTGTIPSTYEYSDVERRGVKGGDILPSLYHRGSLFPGILIYIRKGYIDTLYQ